MGAPFVRAAVAIGVLTVAGGGVWLAMRDQQPAPQRPTEEPAPAAAPEQPSPTVPVSAPLPLQTPAEAGVAEADCIVYPDGTKLPPLNGVTKAPPVTFHRLVPYAKVVRKERDRTGLEWYIHENGVRSTTKLQWRNGVQEAVSEVDMPRPPAPVVPDK
jgi:hypothetical protein